MAFLLLSPFAVEGKKLKAQTYERDFTVGKGKELKGGGRDKTVIVGEVLLKHKSKLKNLTVKNGGVKVSRGASVTIENVRITGSTGTAIVTEGGGTLTLRNSIIEKSRNKGLYIQYGKDVVIVGNKIRRNGEEGIDIRANVDGVISGNIITDNGESGLEVIVGKSDLDIKNNVISNNRASGIAAQYYVSTAKKGGLRIISNRINDNRNYALTCKNPSGGRPPAGYWRNSIVLAGNNLKKNRRGAFGEMCSHLRQGLTEEEKEIRRRKLLQLRLQNEKTVREKEAMLALRQEEVRQMIFSSAQNRLLKMENLLGYWNAPAKDFVVLTESLSKTERRRLVEIMNELNTKKPSWNLDSDLKRRAKELSEDIVALLQKDVWFLTVGSRSSRDCLSPQKCPRRNFSTVGKKSFFLLQ